MKRNIILLSITILFVIIMTTLWSFVLTDKYDQIVDLEDSQKEANEKFITTQILSDSLYYVYNMFEKNLAQSKNDPLNKQASRTFINDLTDIFSKININGVGVSPAKKYNKGKYTYVPYELEFTCDYPRFGRLLAELSASERIIKIDEFKFINTPDQVRRSTGDKKQLPGAKITMTISTVTLNK